MRLAVLGSMPAAVVTAAWAAAESDGPVVVLNGRSAAREAPMHVFWQDAARPAIVDWRPAIEQVQADAFVIVASRDELRILARQHRHALAGRPVLLAPGGIGVTEEFAESFRNWSLPAPLLGQLPGFPILGDVRDGIVDIRAIKRRLPVGTPSNGDSAELQRVFHRWLADLEPSSLTETSLSNANNLLHPPMMLANAARIERAEPFLLYRHGVSGSTARLIEAIDQDRLAILAAVGRSPISLASWLQRFYGDQGLAGADLLEMLTSFAPWARLPGPTGFDHRFLTDDVSHGLAPLEEIAAANGVETPALSSLLTTLSCLTGRDVRAGAAAAASRFAGSS